jgi:hypothetical protein
MDWPVAIVSAEKWFLDQPFSTQAATYGSWAACEAKEWSTVLKFCDRGLRVDPESLGLLNNSAFAKAQLGDVEGAAQAIHQARALETDQRFTAVLLATEGLTLYRAGRMSEGRERCESAIKSFQIQGSRNLAAEAAIMLATEELGAMSPNALRSANLAMKLSGNATAPNVIQHAAQLRRQIDLLSDQSVSSDRADAR